MRNPADIIYSLNIEDLQNVAIEELERTLSDAEIRLIENKLGDFIDWRSAIEAAMRVYIVAVGSSRRRR